MSVLAVLEQRAGQWSRMSFETLAAAQQTVESFAPTAQPQDANVVAEPPGGWDRTTAGPPAHVKSRPARPLALGAFEVGKQ